MVRCVCLLINNTLGCVGNQVYNINKLTEEATEKKIMIMLVEENLKEFLQSMSIIFIFIDLFKQKLNSPHYGLRQPSACILIWKREFQSSLVSTAPVAVNRNLRIVVSTF